MRFLKSILLALLLLSVGSCIKEVDFNQIDAVEIEPNLLITFAHLKLEAFNFPDDNKLDTIGDAVQLPIDNTTEQYLKKVAFKIVTDNSFNNKFNVEVLFLNKDSIPFYTLKPTIVVNPNTKNDTTIVEIPSAEVYNIFQMEYVGFLVKKFPAQNNISNNNDSELVLKSSINLSLNFKK